MENKGLPGQESQPGEAVCQSCGRFVGPARRCQYCGAPVRQRISVRFFRWAAVLLATVGLAILYWTSISREVPRMRIGDISSTMNFAYINVEGELPRSARVYRSGGLVSSVSFSIDDGTGSIPVRAYGKKGQELVDSGKLPRAGDRITMDGSLNVSADDRKLYLQVPESLKILEGAGVEDCEIGDLDRSAIGTLASLRGTVARVIEPRSEKQPWLIEIDDGSGSIALTLWSDTREHMPAAEEIAPGAVLELVAEVSSYRDELRLQLDRASDLMIVGQSGDLPESDAVAAPEPEPGPDRMRIADLDMDDKGRLVEVSGKLGKAVSIKGGSFRILYGDAGEIKLLLWDSRIGGAVRERISAGDRVSVAGRIKIYKGELEIVPSKGDDIRILEEASAAGDD